MYVNVDELTRLTDGAARHTYQGGGDALTRWTVMNGAIMTVNTFKWKLKLLKAHLSKNSFSHFRNVKRITENLNMSVDEFD